MSSRNGLNSLTCSTNFLMVTFALGFDNFLSPFGFVHFEYCVVDLLIVDETLLRLLFLRDLTTSDVFLALYGSQKISDFCFVRNEDFVLVMTGLISAVSSWVIRNVFLGPLSFVSKLVDKIWFFNRSGVTDAVFGRDRWV